ncbi:MAG: DNA alkylation repair protein [Planctomycetota bacterium]
MKLKEALKELEALGDEKMRKQNLNHGSGDNQFGVRRGDVRKVAKKIKADHDLALELWDTGNIDARFLAILIMKPKELSADEVDRLVRSEKFVEAADWLSRYVVMKHPDREALREDWMTSDDPMAGRAGWALTADRVAKSPEGLDLPALLDRVESEMGDAVSEVQWTMNFVLAEIGIHHAKQRKRAIAIGEKLGVYRDFPVSKGCTSPFAPVWIDAMVSRKK